MDILTISCHTFYHITNARLAACFAGSLQTGVPYYPVLHFKCISFMDLVQLCIELLCLLLRDRIPGLF